MATPGRRITPELLAPAGDWDCVKAAIANGADAVYFGLQGGHNARYRAANFSLEEVPALMDFLFEYGVKGYVAVNTLAFSSELKELEKIVRSLAQARVDGLLVQDLGLARLVRAVSSDLPLHASTQMTITSAECLQALQDLRIDRVVLARELSIAEISEIRDQTSIPLEVFVHGALCVAYSGQCLTSESFGGRSANRGQCAQACRLPYDLVCDGEDVDLGDQKYLLSPQDLAAYAIVEELIDAGVCSLKIEGRLKTPEYTANITRHYRRAVDAAVAGQDSPITKNDVEEMELSFSRGFSPGWLLGCDHKRLTPALSSAKRGVAVGSVVRTQKGCVVAALRRPVRAGDGVCFEGDRANQEEQGGRVYQIRRLDFQPSSNSALDKSTPGKSTHEEWPENEEVLCEIAFEHGAIDFTLLKFGQTIWKSDDPQLTKRLRKSFSGRIHGRDRPINLAVRAEPGARLTVLADAEGKRVQLESREPLAEAINRPLTKELLEEQFARISSAGFKLESLDAEIIGNPMAPLSVLGAVRRQLVEKLQELKGATRNGWQLSERTAIQRLFANLPMPTENAPNSEASQTRDGSRLWLLCRSLEQVRVAVDLGERHLYADFADIRQYREAVEIAKGGGAELLLATPRIHKPGETGIFRTMAKYGPSGVLVRNMAAFAFFQSLEIPIVADFSLNAANELTLDFLVQRGARRVTAAYDLNREQLSDLVRKAPRHPIEVVIHQHMPLFHMEHCVFCSVLSPGTNKTNCGRPCDVHLVHLRDRIGQEHLLTADVGCRNTLFNAIAQSGAEVVPSLLALGVTDFRVELLGQEGRGELQSLFGCYRDLLEGKRSGKEVWASLKASNRLGVTRGALEERRNPLAIL